jgi:DNA-binding LacI/PurR family transcriptional regulator
MTMANIRDIARIANVSLSTVSRVINEEKYVSEETRQHVQSIIEEVGYIRNGNAVKLSTGKTKVIGVQFPYNSTCYSQLIDSILLTSKENNYQVQLLPTYYEVEAEKYYYTLLEQKLIDGLILTSRTHSDFELKQLLLKGKIVTTEKMADSTIPMIFADREQAYEEVFAYIFSRYVKDFVFIVKRKPEESQTTKNKIQIFEKYFDKAKENKNFFTGIDQYDEGYLFAKELVKEKRVPEVIYANGDDIAAGVLHAFQEAGLTHKRDFMIIGEGNLSYSKIFNFSTIDFYSNVIGRECVEFLLSDKETINCPKKPTFILRD